MVLKEGYAPRDGALGSHGNTTHSGGPRPLPPSVSVRKIPASSVEYGESVSLNGQTVWAVYDDGVLVCIAPTAPEARRKYRAHVVRESTARHAKRAEGNGQKS